MKHEMRTDVHEGDLVVFLLGMRPRWTWRIGQAIFASRAMFRMQDELDQDVDDGGAAGYLGGFNAVTTKGPLVVQYWRSFEALERYAHDADAEHRPAWLAFYAMTHGAGAARVGLWHETFRVPAGAHESIYADLGGPVGLGAAVGVQPLSARGLTSRERVGV